MKELAIWEIKEGFSLGYLKGERDQVYQQFDEQFGSGNWRIVWRLANGEIQDYITHFYQNFVGGYAMHFVYNPDEALFLTEGFSYAYDKNLISKKEAFDPCAYHNRPGYVNQIHNVALNIALERILGMPFKGEESIQVRGGDLETDPATWPKGWRCHPGRIMTPRPDLIPNVQIERTWDWEPGSIEEMYQRAKVIQVRADLMR